MLMRIGAKGGHILLVFSKVAWQFNELKVLVASAKRDSMVSSLEKMEDRV